MAQPQQQYPSRAYSPLQSGAPSHPSFLAPNKRQRLSPGAPSPYNSPSMSNIALPNQVFSSPYYGAQPNGSTTNNSYNTMNPTPQAGAMGPPSRPVDKPTDMNELTDVLLGSGVDLKEEEAALLGRYNSMHQHGDTAFTSGMTTAFNSFGPSVSHISNSAGANMLSSNIPGDRSSFYGAGTFNQPSTPFQTIEERAEIDRKAAYRRKCERWQHHLNDPFLLTGWLQRRISSQAQTVGVSIPHAGLVSTTNVIGKMTELAVAGPDNNEVLTTLKGQDLLPHNSPLVEILALLSLAAEERLSNLIEDAATFAQGRRIGSHGVVPKDLADLAVGAGEYESLAALPTPSNSAVSPKSNPLKRKSRV